METPSAPPAPKRDPWVGRLAITAIVLAVVTVLAYVGYLLVLGQAIPTTAEILLNPPFNTAQALNGSGKKRQGMTSIVPQKPQNNAWALAPAKAHPVDSLPTALQSPERTSL